MTSLIEVSNPAIFELIGVAGFGLYVMNYTLLTFHKLHSHDALYFAINLVAASCVLAGLLVSFNLASAMIQLFWVVISTAAIVVRGSSRHTTRLPRQSLRRIKRPQGARRNEPECRFIEGTAGVARRPPRPIDAETWPTSLGTFSAEATVRCNVSAGDALGELLEMDTG